MRRELEKIGYLIGANIARASNPFTTKSLATCASSGPHATITVSYLHGWQL